MNSTIAHSCSKSTARLLRHLSCIALLVALPPAMAQAPKPSAGAPAKGADEPGTLQKVGGAVERGVKAAASAADRGVGAAASGVKAAGGAVERGAKAAGNAVSAGAKKVGLPASAPASK